ncbi:MAG TPA: hypothetical protein VGN77_01210 [Steroidobacteraceae bacterium]|nr:hypothetical protein [Steroidobacteraceae bacterium]
MNHRHLTFIAGALLAGCASQPAFLDAKQSMAVDTALARGKFDMNCPAAQGSVLSRQFIQAPMAGPRLASVGVDRAEYTVGVQGCDQRGTYMVVCTQGTEGCIAGDRSGERSK